MNTEVEYVSPEKLEELKEELHNLQHVVRPEIAEEIGVARSMGDLSENAEYHAARERQAETEARIRELEEMLKRVVIISSKRNNDMVQAGATVELRKKSARSTVTYTIVGSEESDVAEGKISYYSPLGSALMGKKVGDECSVDTPKGEVVYTIVTIS